MPSNLESLSERFPAVAKTSSPLPTVAGTIVVYNDTAVPNTMSVRDSTGLACPIPKVLTRVAALAALGATTSELVGVSFTGVPANDFVVGRIVRIRLWGIATNIAVATTLTLRLRLGTGAVAAVGGAASANAIVASVVLTTAAAAKTTVPWTYGVDLTVYSTGTAGSCLGQIHYSGGPAGGVVQTGTGLTAAVALNTTVANNLDFTLQSASGTDITATTVHGGSIELH